MSFPVPSSYTAHTLSHWLSSNLSSNPSLNMASSLTPPYAELCLWKPRLQLRAHCRDSESGSVPWLGAINSPSCQNTLVERAVHSETFFLSSSKRFPIHSSVLIYALHSDHLLAGHQTDAEAILLPCPTEAVMGTVSLGSIKSRLRLLRHCACSLRSLFLTAPSQSPSLGFLSDSYKLHEPTS